MMGRQISQMEIAIVDLSEIVPTTHLLKKIDSLVDFSFIYEKAENLYSSQGRPSIDPVLLVKMLLIGYLYGIKSERKLEEEVSLNLAYRWFCGLGLSGKVPDHSTFSQNRRRRFRDSDLFEEVFVTIVERCVEKGLVDGELVACDGTYIPCRVSESSISLTKVMIKKGMQSYLDVLDQELEREPGFQAFPVTETTALRQKSTIDPDAGLICHGDKVGLGYLMEASVDSRHGVITGVDVYPANQKESSIVLKHLEKQVLRSIPIKRVALDKGYDVGAVHRGLELLGIEGYIASVEFSNTADKKGMSYLPGEDCFLCPQGHKLPYHHIICQKSTGKYLRCYRADMKKCDACPMRASCLSKLDRRRKVIASGFYPAFHRGRERYAQPESKQYMKLRGIWAEGSFAMLKREHKLNSIQKHGILKAKEECLLACIAANLKRMAKAIHVFCHTWLWQHEFEMNIW